MPNVNEITLGFILDPENKPTDPFRGGGAGQGVVSFPKLKKKAFRNKQLMNFYLKYGFYDHMQ